MVEVQGKPTYAHKFLKEPPTVAVSLLVDWTIGICADGMC